MKKRERLSPVFMVVDRSGFVWTASATRRKDDCYDALVRRGHPSRVIDGDRIVEYRPYFPRKSKSKKKAKRRA